MASTSGGNTAKSDASAEATPDSNDELGPGLILSVCETRLVPAILGVSHVALTVRDMEKSAEWYQRVFGWVELGRLVDDEAIPPRILLFDMSSGFALGLTQPRDGSADDFDYRRTGLDHLAFGVSDDDELARWSAHLDEVGVAHSPVRELELGKFVSFEDPDGIQLELWLTRR